MLVFFGIVALCMWLGILGFLAVQSVFAFEEGRRGKGWLCAGATMFLFALVLALVVNAEPEDPNAGRLCAAGHEGWVTEHGSMLVGKMVMPTTETKKRWFCDRWESQ